MNDKTLQLTDYQQATLTEMGITLWRQSSHQAHDSPSTSENVDVVTPSEAGQLPDAIAKFRQNAAAPAVTDVAADVKAQAEVKSLSDKVLLTVEGMHHTRLANDILLALNLTEETVAYFPNQPLSDFCDYRFVWSASDKVSLQDNRLSTPASLDAETKKALWTLLSEHAE